MEGNENWLAACRVKDQYQPEGSWQDLKRRVRVTESFRFKFLLRFHLCMNQFIHLQSTKKARVFMGSGVPAVLPRIKTVLHLRN